MSRLFRRDPPRQDGLDVGALAPMVDLMTILLVFLLRSWSTEPAAAAPEAGFALAGTRSEEGRKGGVELVVGRGAVWVDGERVVALDRLGDDPVVRPVYDRLLALRAPPRVEVLVDREVSWRDLQRVLSTVHAAGVGEISLVGANAASL
jgi:biopolymer transport protein ExbD